MQSPDSQVVINRFFQALQYLKSKKIIRGKQTFTNRYGVNRWNLNALEKEPSRDMFELAWFTYLVNDYNISADWLLTGKGEIMQSDNTAENE